jgi:hypothetical protein
MSFTFKGAENFGSIPGLKLYLDGRLGKTIVNDGGTDKVSIWLDSAEGRAFSSPLTVQRPKNHASFVDFDDNLNVQGLQIRATPTPTFNFFHDGSPFGYFEIMGFKQGVAAVITSRLFSTRAGSGTGANVSIAANNRMVYQIVNAGSLDLGIQTAINSIPQEVINTMGVTRNSLSETNNIKLYANNVVSLQTTSSVVGSANGNSLSMGFINNKRYLPGLKILYDWTGYTSSEVEVFSARVRALLEVFKLNFTYPV